jgi:hypothetical protein
MSDLVYQLHLALLCRPAKRIARGNLSLCLLLKLIRHFGSRLFIFHLDVAV